MAFSTAMELALYAETGGFYESGGGVGRRRDFLTSPEVGPLFGAVLARAIDAWWAELGRPDPFVVVDAGAGPGTLAVSLLDAAPECAAVLRLVLVDRSTAMRAHHGDHLELTTPSQTFPTPPSDDDAPPVPHGPIVTSLGELPSSSFSGVIVANELLDNLPADLLERDGGEWLEIRVGEVDGRLVEVRVPAGESLLAIIEPLADEVADGGRVPVQTHARRWVAEALSRIDRGRVVAFDYASTTPAMAERAHHSWLRTYRAHDRGGEPLVALGTSDITMEVALDQLPGSPDVTSQAKFLRRYGIDDLVEEGRRIWAANAAAPDLTALKARSRIAEAEALLDPAGLGGFAVLGWTV